MIVKQFGRLFDVYYWQTAILIAKNGLARNYRNSFLGILWTMFQPLTMAAIFAFMMPKIMRFEVPNYTLYIMVSIPIWSFISGTLIYASFSIINNGETLKRCMISSTVFPVADVLRYVYTFFVSFVTMYTLAVLFFAPFHATALLLPLYFIPVLMIVGSAAIAIAFLAPYVRDVSDLVMLSMNILYWLTPVVYPFSILKPSTQAWMKWNPFFIMIHPLQMLAYEGIVPGNAEMRPLLGLTVVAILLGYGIFRLCRRNYVYYL